MIVPTLLLLQVIVLPPQPDPRDPYRLPPAEGPELGAIEVHGDSVLFMTRPELRSGRTSATVYGFDRSIRRWGRFGVAAEGSRGDPFGVRSSARLAVRDGFPIGDDGTTLVTDPRARFYSWPEDGTVRLSQGLLRPSGDTLWFVLPAPEHQGDLPSERINSLAVEGDTLWLGLLGHGRTDMMAGTTGGLVAFDMRTQRSRAFWLPELRHNTINAIVRVDGRLWLGTNGGIGIREDDGAWRWERRGDLGLPTSSVAAIQQLGDTIWLATGAGPGGLAGRSWFGPRWVPTLEGDSIVMDLTERPPDWTEHDAILRLGWALELGPRGALFVRAMEALPREWLDSWRAGERDYADVLLYPTLYPYLAEAFLRRPGTSWIASRAVASQVAESEELARDLLRRADGAATAEARAGAYTLLSAYPSLLLEDARRVLARDSISRAEHVLAVRTIGRLGDTSDLELLFDRASYDGRYRMDGPDWTSIRRMIDGMDVRALQRLLRQRPLDDRITVLRNLGAEPSTNLEPRPTIVAECFIGLEAFRDPSASLSQRSEIGRALEALNVVQPIPFLIDRPDWKPDHFIDHMLQQPEDVRRLPLDPRAPRFDARGWVRSWWAQIGRFRPGTDCWDLQPLYPPPPGR